MPPKTPGPFANNPIKPGLPNISARPKVPKIAPPHLPGFAKTPPAPVPQTPIQGMQANALYGPAEKFAMPASRASQIASGIGNTVRNVAASPLTKTLSAATVPANLYSIAGHLSQKGIESGRVKTDYKPDEIGTKQSIVGRVLRQASGEEPGSSPEAIARQSVTKPITPLRPDGSQVPVGVKTVPIQGLRRDSPVAGTEGPKKPFQRPHIPNPNDVKANDALEAGAKASVAPAHPPVSSLPTEPEKTPEPQQASPPAAAPRVATQPVVPDKPDNKPATQTPPKPSAPASKPTESAPKKSFKDIRQGDKEAPSGPSWVNDIGNGGALQNRSRVFGSDAGG